MFLLILLWTLIGLCLGLLTLPASLHPTLRYSWIILPCIGMISAILVGLAGIFLLGRDVATALVLWVTVLALLVIPRLFARQWFGQQFNSASR